MNKNVEKYAMGHALVGQTLLLTKKTESNYEYILTVLRLIFEGLCEHTLIHIERQTTYAPATGTGETVLQRRRRNQERDVIWLVVT